MLIRILSILIGYIIGCVQSAYIVGKAMRVDIRQHGSGNLGTTNALRVLGKKAGAITFFCDVLKSAISFMICYKLFGAVTAGVFASCGAVLGHDFPFYLNFKGGKGMAATVGMVLCLGIVTNPLMILITYGAGILAIVFSAYVSLGSMIFSALIPICCLIFGVEMEVVIVTACMCALGIYKHRANIVRIKNGSENRLFAKKN